MKKILTALIMLLGLTYAYAQNDAFVDHVYGDISSIDNSKSISDNKL